MFRWLIISVFVFCFSIKSNAQFGYGLFVSENFATTSLATGLRVSIPINHNLNIVPMVTYAPNINILNQPNPIEENVFSVQMQYFLFNPQKKGYKGKTTYNARVPSLYILAGVDLEQWVNYGDTNLTFANKNNVLPTLGIGSGIGTTMVRFFVEAKYNPLWNESSGNLGFMIYPKYIKDKYFTKCPR